MTTDWRADALCAQIDPELFFPEKGGNAQSAKAICAKCDVRRHCLEWALNTADGGGVAGGLSLAERRALRKQRGIPTPHAAATDAARAAARTFAQAGRSNDEIAADLGVSARTVARWVTGIREEVAA